MKCDTCDSKYYKYKIKDFRYWVLNLHENQSHLGRVVFDLKRHLEDLLDVSKEEWDELKELVIKYKKVVTALFNPDLFNYASLGNKTRHVHFHIITRYKDKRIFEGVEFTDKRFGLNYAPYPDCKLEDKIMFKIIEKIKETYGKLN